MNDIPKPGNIPQDFAITMHPPNARKEKRTLSAEERILLNIAEQIDNGRKITRPLAKVVCLRASLSTMCEYDMFMFVLGTLTNAVERRAFLKLFNACQYHSDKVAVSALFIEQR